MNTPELGECYGSQATARRKELVAAGFRALTYTTDRYGRAVSVVTTADGTNLNVWLARNGYANDRYLEQYRQENPGLAGELDEAFATAKHERAGVWGACTDGGDPSVSAPTPAPPAAPQPASPSVTAAPTGVRSSSNLYSSCSQARAQGAAPMRRGEPGYRSELDGDHTASPVSDQHLRRLTATTNQQPWASRHSCRARSCL